MRSFLKSTGVSLSVKLTLLIEGIVVVLIVLSGLIATIREKTTLESELRKRGLALAADLARFMERPLLSQDLPTLRRFVNQTMEQDYVRYVIILDTGAKVVMHNDLSAFGRVFTDALSVAAVKSDVPGYTDVHTSEDEEAHCDIFMPVKVSNVRLGTIRLGYSYLAIQEEIKEVQRQIILIGLLTAIVSGFAAFLLAMYISSPIKSITEATVRIAHGHLDTQLTIERNDEIGTLAGAFNKMTEDLKTTTVSKNYFDNIIRSMNDILLVVDLNSKIRSVNKAACDLLEFREDDLVGEDANCILSDGEGDFFEKLLEYLRNRASSISREIQYVTRTGKRVPMLFSAALMRDNQGKLEGVVCIARDMTERKKAEDALKESEKELHFLSSQLLNAQEEERRRLATELHDELGQSLMVLKLKLRAMQEKIPKEQQRLIAECEEGIRYINEVVENVRRLSRDLSPSVLESLGLSAAVRRLIEAFAEHSKIHCSLDMKMLGNVFSREEEITIYRIIQESLTNVAKHARATRVSVAVKEEVGFVSFQIEDDGRSFTMREALGRDPARKGLGLSTMQERARMLGGTMNILAGKGEGTRIAFSVPRHNGGGKH